MREALPSVRSMPDPSREYSRIALEWEAVWILLQLMLLMAGAMHIDIYIKQSVLSGSPTAVVDSDTQEGEACSFIAADSSTYSAKCPAT